MIPKEETICQHTMALKKDLPSDDSAVINNGTAFVIPDLRADDRFKHASFVDGLPYARFYAGVPIRSPKGVTIGVLGVLDDAPRGVLPKSSLQFLEDTATTIMDYLVMARSGEARRRGERMIFGLSSFVEGKTTLDNSWGEPLQLPSPEQRTDPIEGVLNTKQQVLQNKQKAAMGLAEEQRDTLSGITTGPPPTIEAYKPGIPPKKIRCPLGMGRGLDSSPQDDTNPGRVLMSRRDSSSARSPRRHSTNDSGTNGVKQIVSRAANILRESLEVEGAAFFDATVSSFSRNSTLDIQSSDSSTSEIIASSSDNERRPRTAATASSAKSSDDEEEFLATPLGYSTTRASSINDESLNSEQLSVSVSFLKSLLRWYPYGKIFNFDASGNITSSDNSDSVSGRRKYGQATKESAGAQRRKKTRQAIQKQAGETLIKMFPGASSVAFVSMWDTHRARWFAGAFIWTHTPSRIFSVKTELAYLYALGNSVIAEIHRFDMEMAEKAKADLVSSISHEIRSPLHGILGTSELLNSTRMSPDQRVMLHTIESCGRTLLDIVNHLLDFSKINTLSKDLKLSTRKRFSRQRLARNSSKNTKSKSPRDMNSTISRLSSPVPLDAVCEEVIDAIFAGHNFYHHPTPRLYDLKGIMSITDSLQELPDPPTHGSQSSVTVIFDVDAAEEWNYITQAGAWRRVLMNTFGNALKYTSSGYVFIKLSSNPLSDSENNMSDRGSGTRVKSPGSGGTCVTLTIRDTGKGISQEYLQTDLFTPFSQEDSLSAGSGLGLSIVRQTVRSLGGRIEVKSALGVGTEISISIDLKHPASDIAPIDESTALLERVKDFTRGKSVGVLGFETPPHGALALLRGSLEQQCRNWFEMDVDLSTTLHDANKGCEFYIMIWGGEISLGNLVDFVLKQADGTGAQASIIILCRTPNEMRAAEREVAATSDYEAVVIEIFNSPCGPRKLARVLNSCIRRKDNRCSNDQAEQDAGFTDQASGIDKMGSPSLDKHSSVDQELYQPPALFASHEKLHFIGSTDEKPNHDCPECDAYRASLATSPQSPQATFERFNLRTLPASVSSQSASTSSKSLAALIVDDNPINLQILIAFMKKARYDYVTATNGLEAFKAFESDPKRFQMIMMGASPILLSLMLLLNSTNEMGACFRSFDACHGWPYIDQRNPTD